MLYQMVMPRKAFLAFPGATAFGTVNPGFIWEVHRIVVPVEVCRAAEAALTTRKNAEVPGWGSGGKN